MVKPGSIAPRKEVAAIRVAGRAWRVERLRSRVRVRIRTIDLQTMKVVEHHVRLGKTPRTSLVHPARILTGAQSNDRKPNSQIIQAAVRPRLLPRWLLTRFQTLFPMDCQRAPAPIRPTGGIGENQRIGGIVESRMGAHAVSV